MSADLIALASWLALIAATLGAAWLVMTDIASEHGRPHWSTMLLVIVVEWCAIGANIHA